MFPLVATGKGFAYVLIQDVWNYYKALLIDEVNVIKIQDKLLQAIHGMLDEEKLDYALKLSNRTVFLISKYRSTCVKQMSLHS